VGLNFVEVGDPDIEIQNLPQGRFFFS